MFEIGKAYATKGGQKGTVLARKRDGLLVVLIESIIGPQHDVIALARADGTTFDPLYSGRNLTTNPWKHEEEASAPAA